MNRPHTILYAEDDLDDLFLLQQAFEQHGHIRLVHAGNGWEALQILYAMEVNGHLPCLVILDINMPIKNGRDTLIEIRQTPGLRQLPVVLFSTSSSTADRAFAEEWKVDLITKPLVYSDLRELAENFVNRCNFEINHRFTDQRTADK